jgi:hypothetical protein
MMVKHLDILKTSSIDDNDLASLIRNSFGYYVNNSIKTLDKETIHQDENKLKIFSNLVRYFRNVNSNKKFDEEAFNSFLKEILKDKPKSITILTEKVNEVISVQQKRINFTDKLNHKKLNFLVDSGKLSTSGLNDLLNDKITDIKNFSFRVNVTISNNFSNRVLSPEIYFYFTFKDGSSVQMKIDVKIFQELRKCLAYHIKKMIDNESVQLLK